MSFDRLPPSQRDALPDAPRRPTPTPAAGARAQQMVLSLQRTAGTQAVARMLRAGRPVLQRAPMSDADPASDDFWDSLMAITESQLLAWLSGHVDQAVDQFFTDLTQTDASDSSAGFILDTALELLPLAVPEAGEAAALVYGIAKGLYDEVSGGETVSLPDFFDTVRKNRSARTDAIVNHEDPLFLHIRERREAESAGDPAARAALAAEISAAIAALPTMQQLRQAYSLDWIRSSIDTWDWNSEAGVINVAVVYHEMPSGDAHFDVRGSPWIDDVSKPDGIITALKSAFGEATPLELLPLKMIVTIAREETLAPGAGPIRTGGTTQLVNPPRDGKTLRDAPEWSSGPYANEWAAKRPRLTVGDLEPE